MIFKDDLNLKLPTIALLHGGGLSAWSLEKIKALLEGKYNVILPIIDGHGGDIDEFESIEKSASKLIKYIDYNYNGKIFAIAEIGRAHV